MRWRQALLLSSSMGLGCMRTLPPMPNVTVVSPSPAKASTLHVSDDDAKDEEREDDDEDSELAYVSPCKEGSIAMRSAEIAKDAFGRQVDALIATSDPKPLERELEQLLDHPCFELAKNDPHEELTFANAVSLRDWWREGGSDWLWSYLHLDTRRSVRTSPTPRVALTLEIAPKDHPLSPLLCPADRTKPCATESAGWTRRAHETLSLLATRGSSAKDESACRADAMKEPKARRYGVYRDCLEYTVSRERMLPLGRFKAPSDGWLVFVDDEGARCHHARSYDLTTGATYQTSDCGGGATITSGRVPVAALREAAWMLFLARETQADVRLSHGFYVPDDMAIKRVREESITIGNIGCACGPTQIHSWSWMRAKNGVVRGQISGRVEGRGGTDVALQHAFDLLDIADASLDTSCVPAPPPARIAWSSPGLASHEDEVAVLDAPESEVARSALVKAKMPRTCTPKP